MEENVALDSSKQKQFIKSLKGIKKLIKKNDAKDDSEVIKEKVRDGKIFKKRRHQRGLVYLSHIPHGFYENEMTQYFKQFGVVTNARVIRSKRTGNSKGFAFVEFKDTTVGQIVAETMNNYLMGKRLIKAVYIPPEKQKPKAMRKHWNAIKNPGNDLRVKMKQAYNANKSDKEEVQRAKKILSRLFKTQKKLKELGIHYDFKPVDMPEYLIKIKTEKEDGKENTISNDNNSKSKKGKKELKTQNLKDNAEKTKDAQKVKQQTKKKETQINKHQKIQTQKEKELKTKGVKPVEEFIKVQESDSESDAFVSEEFEKMQNDEESDLTDDVDESEGGYGSDESSFVVEAIQEKTLTQKMKTNLKPAQVQNKAHKKQLQNKTNVKPVVQNKMVSNAKQAPQKKPKKKVVQVKADEKQISQQEQKKRKIQNTTETPQKKQNFEKQINQKAIGKQFKKKK